MANNYILKPKLHLWKKEIYIRKSSSFARIAPSESASQITGTNSRITSSTDNGVSDGILSANKRGFVAVTKKAAAAVTCIIAALIVGAIVANIVILALQHPALYTENCESRACQTGYNLKCLENKCNCYTTEYYDNGCKDKKDYNQSCVALQECRDGRNMVCLHGFCKCNQTNYWNGQSCKTQKSYSVACSSSFECMKSVSLICDPVFKICSCDGNNSFWDSSRCILKKSEGESCLLDTHCNDSAGLVCFNSTCECDTFKTWNGSVCLDSPSCINCTSCNSAVQFWNGTMCVDYYSYNETCENSLQCKGTLLCNKGGVNACSCPIGDTFNKCDCPNSIANEFYWNGHDCVARGTFGDTCSSDYMCRQVTQGTICSNDECNCLPVEFFNIETQKCEQQMTINETCSLNINCRGDLGLICDYQKCTCNSSIQYWNGSMCFNYLSFNESCGIDTDCKSILECNSLSNRCDCPNKMGNEYYWNGFDCSSKITFGGSCDYDTMCKTLSQGAICTNSVCQCPFYQYFNLNNQKCEQRLSINETCNLSSDCRTDQGLICDTSKCSCNVSNQFWNGSVCADYHTYSEQCETDFECKGILLCNNGLVNCSCPQQISNRRCDCPNSVSNEYFWNVTSCQPRLYFGENCTSNYMCRMLSENTFCLSNLCKCLTFQYFNVISQKCEHQLLINETCTISSDCRTDLGLNCEASKCACNGENQFWNGSTCVDYYTYNEPCETDYQCNGILLCNNGTINCSCPNLMTSSRCDCPNSVQNEQYWSGIDCVPRVPYGQPCSHDFMCKLLSELTICSFGTCQCRSSQYFNTIANKCDNQFSQNQPCTEHNQCMNQLGLSCIDYRCLCNNSTQFWNGTRCIDYSSYNETCIDDSECKGVLLCNDGSNLCTCPLAVSNQKCDCPNTDGNEYFWNGVRCEPRSDYGDNCTLNYMCRSFSQGTICSNSICDCPSFQYFNSISQQCENQLLNEEACSSQNNCRNDLGLNCQDLQCLCDGEIQFWNGSTCVDYYTYNEPCLNDDQCDDILLCNNGLNNCSCPSTVSNGRCDCPMSLGSEYYWTGSSCEPRSVFNENCSSNYMCQSLSQGTICSNNTCKCAPFQYFDQIIEKCKSQLLINATCDSNTDCRNDLGLSCTDLKCLCNSTNQFWNGTRCVDYYTYNEACQSDDQCNGVLICNNGANNCSCPTRIPNGRCDCPNSIGNEYYWTGTECRLRVAYKYNCSNDYMCKTKTELTICSSNSSTCQCSSSQYFNLVTKKCENLFLVNEFCLTNSECSSQLGLSCMGNACLCNNVTQFWNGTRCVNYYTYNETCGTDEECSETLLCNTGLTDCNCPATISSQRCDCPNSIGSEFYWNDTGCVTRRFLNESCTQDYMCRTLSERTTCLNNTCQCSTIMLYNSTLRSCQDKSMMNETCNSNTECRTDLGLTCQSRRCLCNNLTQFWNTNTSICMNYYNYSSLCTEDYECRATFVCRLNMPCDCPTLLSGKRCDCPNVNGSETFYSTTSGSCLPRRTFNSSCTNSFTCRQISQGTFCNPTSPRRCVCSSSQRYFNSTHQTCIDRCSNSTLQYWNGQQCLNRSTINEACNSTVLCRVDLGLFCTNSICVCNNATQFWNPSTSNCTNYYVYSSLCSQDYECQPLTVCRLNMPCACPTVLSGKRCDCPNVNGSEYYWNGTSCLARRSYNGSCSKTYNCRSISQGTSCVSSRCVCRSTQYYDAQFCFSRKSINGSCNSTVKCREDNGLGCVNGICICNSSQYWGTTRCLNKLSFNLTCTRTSMCSGLLICSNGTCTCPRTSGNETYWDGAQCTSALPIDSTCFANEMCQTLTQATICNLSTLKCECASPNVYDPLTNKCQ